MARQPFLRQALGSGRTSTTGSGLSALPAPLLAREKADTAWLPRRGVPASHHIGTTQSMVVIPETFRVLAPGRSCWSQIQGSLPDMPRGCARKATGGLSCPVKGHLLP
jgi:hypothetical protein